MKRAEKDARYGWRADIWCSVSRKGKFSQNSSRLHTIHADTEKEAAACAGAVLRPKKEHGDFEVSEEYVYSLKCLGRVKYRTVIEYDENDMPNS